MPLPTRRVNLCLGPRLLYAAALSAGSLPVSRAHRSTVLQRQTAERPSAPTGFGKP